jgi:hypothetical protein
MTSFSDYEPAFAEVLGYRTKVGLYVGDAISYVLYSREHVKKPQPTHGLHPSGWFLVAGGGPGLVTYVATFQTWLSTGQGRPERNGPLGTRKL